jgi:pseudaminic acid biosynthesis-associated methylase
MARVASAATHRSAARGLICAGRVDSNEPPIGKLCRPRIRLPRPVEGNYLMCRAETDPSGRRHKASATLRGDMKTQQEAFWAGEFGDAYTERNKNVLMPSRLAIFVRALGRARGIASALEVGCNVGENLDALRLLFPAIKTAGIEINAMAAEQATTKGHSIVCASVLDEPRADSADLVFTSGVLIHIDPAALDATYRFVFEHSRRYVLLIEYFNPMPVEVSYRGHAEKLFKRDFAGEMLDRFPLHLVDYGFMWRRDPVFPQDDVTWFLLAKKD